MRNFVREHFGSLVFSILLHGAIVAALVYGFIQFNSKPKVQPAPAQLAIEGTVVDEQQIAAEVQRQEENERRKEQEIREKAEQVKREQETEQQRLEDLKKQREQEEAAERVRVEKRQAEEVERKKQVELEAKKKEADAKKKAEAEAERKKKAEADRKRNEEDEKRKAAEAKQRAEREAELRRRMEQEERRAAAVASGALAQYVGQIQARIQRAWIRPPSAKAGLRCIVNVTQVPGGEVVAVSVGECNGDDVVRRSIEQAVYRASPLPEPSDPTLFERNLRLEFKPDE